MHFSNIIIPLLYSARLASALGRHAPLQIRQDAVNDTSPVQAFNITMPIDHFNSADNRTYDNQYWLNAEHYRPGGPVFYYDFGESGTEPEYAQVYLTGTENATIAVVELAKRYNGLIVALEHRYYGLSLPVSFNGTNSSFFSLMDSGVPLEGPSGYEYLTVEQALEDVVYFANNFNPPGYSENDIPELHPSKTPWIWLGGSYPGSRGAYMRIRNPEIFYAVWSSSAPVEPRADISVYYHPIYKAMPRNCSSDTHLIVQYVDGILSSSQTDAISYIKQRISATQYIPHDLSDISYEIDLEDANNSSAFDVTQLLMNPWLFGFQSWGPEITTDVFCSYMQSYDPSVQPAALPDNQAGINVTEYMLEVFFNPGNNTPQDSGMVSRYGPDVALNAYLYAAWRYSADFQSRILNTSTIRNEPPYPAVDWHSWQWQCFSELGFAMSSSPGKSWNIVSKYQNVTAVNDYWIDFLFSMFDRSDIPKEPNVGVVARYGGWDMRPSNVMFTNGEFDPWRSLSVASEEIDIGSPMRTTVQDIPACGVPPNGTDVFGLIYPGVTHGFDMAKDLVFELGKEAPLDVGLDLFSKALDVWLPCFKQGLTTQQYM